ncbi:orc1/cdc6 family replication initiation protein [Halomicroarcula sp. GCM10025709]|uniref:Cdc6/Cdc18 family protein n=1 Tax=Haloarcula TaxID=2237 RepID=UPI0024C2858E|nr:orc1/cdc6 family replication initiation protein [Halomicroarcula sp. YJ-61-S]
MITDARALKPDFVPRDLHHRDGQIDHLSAALAPTALDRAEDVCIFGPSGAGKTTIAKYTLSRLERELLELRWGYVDCTADTTPAAVLHRLVREVGVGADLPREGMSTAHAIDRLRECDDQIIAVLDEVSVLAEQPLLALWGLPNVSLICITLQEDEWFADLSAQATSRMQSAATVRLDRYSHAELCDILDSRVAHGLLKSRVEDAAVEAIADSAAGDARRAIAILRPAADHVESTDRRRLTPDVVAAVIEDAEAEIRELRVRSLGTHPRSLYRIIDEAGELDAGTLHARYEARSDAPKSRSSRRRYLRSLGRYDLIETEGTGSATIYRSLP